MSISNLRRYGPPVLLFVAVISLIPFLKPKMIVGLENGVYVDAATDDELVVKDGKILYRSQVTPYALWIGKGGRYLTPQEIIGDLYTRKNGDGKMMPADLTMDNDVSSNQLCSIRKGVEKVCFIKRR